MTIYDSGSSTSTMMGKYCEDSVPPSHISSSNDILINFKSECTATYTGLKMEYNSTSNTSIQNNTEYYRDKCIFPLTNTKIEKTLMLLFPIPCLAPVNLV